MGIRITRVYTKAGDGGQTQLVGGQRVDKDSLRIETYGTVDELNAVIGLIRTANRAPNAPAVEAGAIEGMLKRVQNELFNLGSDLATRIEDQDPRQPIVATRHVEALEADIDRMNSELPDLKSFVLPGGGWVSAYSHQARTVCRRAERLLVALGKQEKISPVNLPYLNRLSDFFFVLGRWAAKAYGEPEPLWTPEST